MTTLAITSDRSATLDTRQLAVQADDLTPLTVTFDAATIALFGANPVFRVDWQLADGTDLYSGNYAVAASVALTIPDSVLAQAGQLQMQVRVSDDAGLVWHSLKASVVLPEAIEAGTPASADTRVYVEVPSTYTPGNLIAYDPVTGKLTDTGISVVALQAHLSA